MNEAMILCDLCKLQEPDKTCAQGNRIPKKMKCVDFTPSIERFCATPEDFTGKEQLYQMALYFGLAGRELKRVKAM